MFSTKQSAPADQPLFVSIDGSCKRNPGHGGHAWFVKFPDGTSLEFLRHTPETTNNCEEMDALISFLE